MRVGIFVITEEVLVAIVDVACVTTDVVAIEKLGTDEKLDAGLALLTDMGEMEPDEQPVVFNV